MKARRRIGKSKRPSPAARSLRLAFLFTLAALLLGACSETGAPKSEPLIVQTAPPAKQEFRWSNGKMPKSFDPAFASAAPETDLVRALFEGLTEINAKTLREEPGVAERWSASDDFKTWTFYLRGDAKWSNGKPVTAQDFVRSWTRLAKMGSKLPHADLFYNIEGLRGLETVKQENLPEAPKLLPEPRTPESVPFPTVTPEAALPSAPSLPEQNNAASDANKSVKETRDAIKASGPTIGVIAESEQVLQVRLAAPDRDFAKLVASPMFRPTFGEIAESENNLPNSNIVTNGAFKLSAVGADGVAMVRSDDYWNRDAVKLERVLFVPKDSAENALDGYRNGELDAVTNADFAPLALKLLSPYDDFRQTTHSALNYYEVNFKKAPFSDDRVRRALAIAIEREVLTEGELEGSTRPALSFLPFTKQPKEKLSEDRDLARELLQEAGFPDGLNFPVIRLVVNRNDLQQRIARLVARMWKQNLNLDTEIIVLGSAEFENAKAFGDYDLIRRGAVFPSNDEPMSLLSIFATADDAKTPEIGTNVGAKKSEAERGDLESNKNVAETGKNEIKTVAPTPVLTEEDAVAQLRAIPLYFPTSYSLVKPYVSGFDFNSLDAPSLKDVSIDNSWQPK
ncbi:MAG: peptide ABC transporter substrate-binding protein [Acidobacteriota bacterium]